MRLSLALRLAVAALAMVVIAWSIPLGEVRNAVVSASPPWVVMGCLLIAASLVVSAFKWKWLMTCHGSSVALSRLVHMNFIGLFYGTVLPGQIAGEAVKVIRLRGEGGTTAVVTAGVAMDRIVGLVGLTLLGATALVADSSPTEGASTALGLVAALTVALVLVLLLAGGLGSAPDSPQRGRIRKGMLHLSTAFRGYTSHPGTLVAAVAVAVVFQFLGALSMATMAHAIGLELPFATIAWLFAVVAAVQMLPVTVAGIGPREGALVYFLGAEGVGAATAVALSALVLVSLLASALVGLVLEVSRGRRSGEAVLESPHVTRAAPGAPLPR